MQYFEVELCIHLTYSANSHHRLMLRSQCHIAIYRFTWYIESIFVAPLQAGHIAYIYIYTVYSYYYSCVLLPDMALRGLASSSRSNFFGGLSRWLQCKPRQRRLGKRGSWRRHFDMLRARIWMLAASSSAGEQKERCHVKQNVTTERQEWTERRNQQLNQHPKIISSCIFLFYS